MPDQSPDDPLTPMGEGASQQHELFMAWVAAGFTEAQALELLKVVIAEGMRNG